MAAIISSSDGLFCTISTKSSADMLCSSRNILSCGHGYMYSPMIPCSFAFALSEILASQGIPPIIISLWRGFQSRDICFTSFVLIDFYLRILYIDYITLGYFLQVVSMYSLKVEDCVRILSNHHCVEPVVRYCNNYLLVQLIPVLLWQLLAVQLPLKCHLL